MPQDLSCRLELLEKEIHGLLKVHEQQCSHVESLMLYQPKNHCRCNRIRSGTQIQASNISFKPCSKTKSAIDSPKKNVCYNKVHFPNIQNRCNKISGVPDGCTKKVLFNETEKIEQAHKIISDLKEELSFSKARMCTMAKDMALLTDALLSIRNKYKDIKIFRKNAIAQIEELKEINAELCRKLEQEMKNHVDQIHQIKERELAKTELKVRQESAILMEQSEETYRKIERSNDQLKQNIKNLNNKYAEAQKEIECLRNELYNYNKNVLAHKQENEDLKILIKNERNKNIIINKTIDKLEATVTDLLKVENKAQTEIALLKEQIVDLEQSKSEHRQNLLKKNKDYNNLETECEILQKQIKEFTDEDNSKCKRIEREMEKLRKQMEERECIILQEKNTLKSLVQELSDIVKRHKARIKELVQINRQQEGLLKNQIIVQKNKEHQIKVAELEVQSVKNNCVHLEEQIDKLKCSIKSFEEQNAFKDTKHAENETKLQLIIDELNNTKSILQEEQDKLLIKEKIIDDQADTIQKLKNSICFQEEAIKTHNCKLSNLQRQLNNEKYDKEQLKQNIEDITWHKEQLNSQIVHLETALKEKCVTPENTDNPKKMIANLQRQVKGKQKEWELRSKLLNKEKKRAVQAAKFATQKLVDTVNDFQAQSESQKQVQFMMANIVNKKTKGCF